MEYWPDLELLFNKVKKSEYDQFIAKCRTNGLIYRTVLMDSIIFPYIYNRIPNATTKRLFLYERLSRNLEQALLADVVDSIIISGSGHDLLFNCLPRLKKLQQLNCQIHDTVDFTMLKYSNLRELKLTGVLTHIIPNLMGVLSETKIKALHLESMNVNLAVEPLSKVLAETMIERLTLIDPKLENLQYNLPGRVYIDPDVILKQHIEFLARGMVGSNIRELHIDNLQLQEEDFLPLIEELPKLKLQNLKFQKVLGPDSTMALIRCLPSSQIERLQIEIAEEFVVSFLESLSKSKVKHLEFGFSYKGFKSSYYQLIADNLGYLKVDTLGIGSLIQFDTYKALLGRLAEIKLKELIIPVWGIPYLKINVPKLTLIGKVNDGNFHYLQYVSKGTLVQFEIGSLTKYDEFISSVAHLWHLKISLHSGEKDAFIHKEKLATVVPVDYCECWKPKLFND
ncbi:hypothetical protein HK103_006072 [Boothiomyces macroporosus]|uniref:Uncharacterized protein n=1 Tax=Boothiomyces macroporosus TaxID=261099 RepID=A0AAD5UHF5_9FUNG|nr:hypothetical protein HK103_006072 [Boothiomyces macroporosus]